MNNGTNQLPRKLPGEHAAQEVVQAAPGPSRTDPNGSYTGTPIWPGEEPEQDADDL